MAAAMVTTMKRWVDGNIGQAPAPAASLLWLLLVRAKTVAMKRFGSLPWLLLAPLLAACVPHGLPQMYFNLYLRRRARRLLPFLFQYPLVTVDIARLHCSGDRAKSNTSYEEVKAYLSVACLRDDDDVVQLQAEADVTEGDGFMLGLREGRQEVADEFRGVTVWWSWVAPAGRDETTLYDLRLTFHRTHRGLIVDDYLPHVRRTGRDMMLRSRRRRLYTNNRKYLEFALSRQEVWSYIDFDHPTTFDTLAMHPDKKREIMDDLDDFRSNGEYYRRIGRAWKRGYLLHGPPGTGKSTMIAAMANYLHYDIYDIQLTAVRSNNDLRKLLVETTARSIIAIEDIDCSLDLTATGKRSKKSTTDPDDDAGSGRSSDVTLSGLLNFIDGLWSADRGERIIVFTTNYLEKLDPALIRSGRMDMQVEMGYCCFEAFTTLANNYLGVDDHPLFDAVEELLGAVVMTPADVAECLMASTRRDRGADACLARLVDKLTGKQAEAAAAAARKEKDAPSRSFWGRW